VGEAREGAAGLRHSYEGGGDDPLHRPIVQGVKALDRCRVPGLRVDAGEVGLVVGPSGKDLQKGTLRAAVAFKEE